MQRTIDLKSKDEVKITKTPQRPSESEVVRNKPLIPSKISWRGPLSGKSNGPLVAVIVTIIFVSSVLVYIFTGEIITATFLALLGLVLYIQSRSSTNENFIEIAPIGVAVNRDVYSAKEIKSFWINYQPYGVKELSLQLDKWYMPYIKVPIDGQNPLHIRALLIQSVPEREHFDTIVDQARRKMGL